MRDPEGTDFLNVEGDLPDLRPEERVVITNLFISIGGQKPTSEEEKNSFYANKVLKAIQAAGKWTGNDDSDVACCIDISTIRRWDATLASWKLPPHVMKGESLQTTFLACVREGFDKYVDTEEEEYEKANGSLEGYLPSVHWDNFVPLLGTGIRYFIQHWHCYPELTRVQNYERAKTTLLRDCTSKYKPHNITKDLIAKQHREYLLRQLEELRTELDGKAAVFTDDCNDDALVIIDQHLRFVGHKYSVKDHLVSLTALQAYLKTLPKNHEDMGILSRFKGMKARETQEYKERIKEINEKKAKKVASAAKKAESEAKKQTKEKKKLEKRLTIQKKALCGGGGGGGGGGDKRKSKRKATKAAAKKDSSEVEEIRLFVKDKLPYLNYKEQTDVPFPSLEEDAPEHHQGPKKIFKVMDVEGVTIGYMAPGNAFCLGLKQRFNSIACLMGLMDEINPDAMAALFKKANSLLQKGKSWLGFEGLNTSVALFLDTAGKLTYFVADDGHPDVEKVMHSPELGDDTLMENLSLDIAHIASEFLDMGKIQLYPLYTTAFFLLFTDEFGNWAGSDMDAIIQLANIVMEDRTVCSAERKSQIENLVVATQMLSVQEDNKGSEEYHVFEVQIECTIPTTKNSERSTRSKKN